MSIKNLSPYITLDGTASDAARHRRRRDDRGVPIRRRGCVHSHRKAPWSRAARTLLPDDRLARRRGRSRSGNAHARLDAARELRGPRRDPRLAVPDRDERVYRLHSQPCRALR